ncbi:beta-1,3-galactosyltransferase 1-like [Apostichopus japonicus]|uniref:beta-1,3-galactosyltransferase 1-like n=1 Tax=Stichopus japonicus TaxID=307972 RepID=UPI003AB7915E
MTTKIRRSLVCLRHCSSSAKRLILISLAGVVILYLLANDQASKTVHTVASYSDYLRLHSHNRYTEEISDGIINPHNYSFVIPEANICKNEDVFLIVLIHSSPSHSNLRNIQRETSLSDANILGKRIIVVYLIGNATKMYLNNHILAESQKYRDIIVEDFKDSYYNLTQKFMMGMRWVSEFCPNARFVLKGDDDVYFNLHNIVKMLISAPSENFMSGYVYKYSRPYRDRHSKWFISEKIYPYKYYPPFCRGYAYVMSGDLPPRLFQVAQHIPDFPLDDVFTGFCARKLNISPVSKVGFRGPGSDILSFCSMNLSHAVHVGDGQMISKLWQEQQENPHQISCSSIAYYIRSLF